jgi:hypothetical protein
MSAIEELPYEPTFDEWWEAEDDVNQHQQGSQGPSTQDPSIVRTETPRSEKR